jgi:hypothetical protein
MRMEGQRQTYKYEDHFQCFKKSLLDDLVGGGR